MSKNFFKGLAVGSIIGSIVGLFAAPKKGSELLAEIKDRAIDSKEDATRVVGVVSSELDKVIKSAKDELSGLGEAAKEELKAVLVDSEELKTELKQIQSQIAKSGSNLSDDAKNAITSVVAKVRVVASKVKQEIDNSDEK